MRFASKHLAIFYYQFGTMIQAGVPIRRALVSLQKSAPKPIRPIVLRLREVVEEGQPLHEAIGQSARRFPSSDVYTLGLSERSGALDVGLLSLSKYHESRARARSRIRSACAFPALLLVAAVFVSRFPALLLGGMGTGGYGMLDYLRDTAGFLGLAALGGFCVSRLLGWMLRTPGIDLGVDRLLRPLPVVGPLRFEYALSQWLTAIRLMLNAGHGIVEAMEYSSRMVPSPLLAHACKLANPRIGSQMEVSEALRSTGVFPEQLLQFWATGEESGRMDEMIDRLARLYEEQWHRSLDHLAAWLPRIAYALVCLFILFQMAQLLGPLIGAYSEALR